MKKPALVELRGRSADWVTAERGLSNVPKNVRSLVVDRKIVGTLEPLTKLTGMRQLFVQGVRKQDMPILGSLRQLRSLLIWRLDATDLHEIRALDSLRDFGVYHAPKLETLKGIEDWKLLKNFFFAQHSSTAISCTYEDTTLCSRDSNPEWVVCEQIDQSKIVSPSVFFANLKALRSSRC